MRWYCIQYNLKSIYSWSGMAASPSGRDSKCDSDKPVTYPYKKPTRRTNFSKFILEWNSTCFGQFHCPSSGVFHCTHSSGTVCTTRYRTRLAGGPLLRVATIRRTTDTFLFVSHTTNVPLFKFRCNIFIGVRIIKEMPGSVASGTYCICHTGL
jgi:hypothetical protein